jgi:hypothetical protein
MHAKRENKHGENGNGGVYIRGAIIPGILLLLIMRRGVPE